MLTRSTKFFVDTKISYHRISTRIGTRKAPHFSYVDARKACSPHSNFKLLGIRGNEEGGIAAFFTRPPSGRVYRLQ